MLLEKELWMTRSTFRDNSGFMRQINTKYVVEYYWKFIYIFHIKSELRTQVSMHLFKFRPNMHFSLIVMLIFFFWNISFNKIRLFSLYREIALCVILLEAGLGLDASTLKRLSFVVARLAIMPCLTETIATAVAIHFLMNMPWIWGLLLGWMTRAFKNIIL